MMGPVSEEGGDETRASTERASMEGVTETVASKTQRMSYFASENGRERLLILGLTPSSSLPTYYNES